MKQNILQEVDLKLLNHEICGFFAHTFLTSPVLEVLYFPDMDHV